ncbi:MAG TPA: non-homologous end-joining DNA ligase [bacterium]|nr:non-homologous end-joining DNA ligase [bacterium]
MSNGIGTTVQVGRRTVELSNLGKILYPATGFTKGQVIEYYRAIAPVLLPHLKGRPLTLKRYPDGVGAFHFYEKQCPRHRPPWVKTITVPSERRGELEFCSVNTVADLLWVANLASVELHVLLSTAKDLQRPTHLVFDLDPGTPATLLDCIQVAFDLRRLLRKFGLASFPKTSGGKGLHLYIPLNTPVTFEETKGFAHAIALLLERQQPDQVTSVMVKKLRVGKVFIDWSQNDDHKTTVCPYSLRAMPRPTVSTPVTWEELGEALDQEDPSLVEFEAPEVIARVGREVDLFEPVLSLKQKLPEV